ERPNDSPSSRDRAGWCATITLGSTDQSTEQPWASPQRLSCDEFQSSERGRRPFGAARRGYEPSCPTDQSAGRTANTDTLTPMTENLAQLAERWLSWKNTSKPSPATMRARRADLAVLGQILAEKANRLPDPDQ